MPVEVRVPTQLGESVTEATVGPWRKRPGDRIEAGEALVELETDKVNLEVTAERSGVLERIEVEEGATVHPGDLLAVVGDAVAAAPAGQPASAAVTSPLQTPTNDIGAPVEAAGAGELEYPHASPLARRIAQEHGIDLAQVAGTGTSGRVTREDVERYLNEQAAAPSAPPPTATPVAATTAPAAGATAQATGTSQPAAQPPDRSPAAPAQPAPPAAATPPAAPSVDGRREERVRMSRRRQTIAQRLVEAQQTAAMLTTFNEVDMTSVMDFRARRRDAFRERHGIALGFMSFFTKAVVAALKAFPRLNAEIQGNEMILKQYYDIGIALGAEEGLVVPVVRDADRKSYAEIERDIAELAEKARTNSLALDDLRGGTFTITNGGVFGSLMSTPILNAPQVGILGMHAIQQRPIARNGEIVIRPMMYLALSYDHRIVDGREAVQFLVRVKQSIEDVESLLLES
ncbi:MAG TPA: 2-oxoglutarate dehydrogenase complex dihydrolipoyllysine-residue succinyltransferase [Dehalococcoidia bacterium]|nr:2-oxoglutarate dehydrogenase complex dihydrolipoyllysine-residue succinyltransferase [Dehalococcoidia bacterium]